MIHPSVIKQSISLNLLSIENDVRKAEKGKEKPESYEVILENK